MAESEIRTAEGPRAEGLGPADDGGPGEHAGFVQAELRVDELDTIGELEMRGLCEVSGFPRAGWTDLDSGEVGRLATGSHRAACRCGWRGPAVDTGVRGAVAGGLLHELVLEAWRAHRDEAEADAGCRLGELTDAYLEGVGRAHSRRAVDDGRALCGSCYGEWPCTTVRLLAEVRRLRAAAGEYHGVLPGGVAP